MPDNPQRSVTYTILILSGIAICLAGTIAALLGVGGQATFHGELGSLKIDTTNVGLALATIGATLAAVAAIKRPKHIIPYGSENRLPFVERLAVITMKPALVVAVLSFVILIVYVVGSTLDYFGS